ncbi:MAG: hypothetical protein PV345_04495 [Wolbachia sp.]|nr:hypothetical protein [Wolbachia sp.]
MSPNSAEGFVSTSGSETLSGFSSVGGSIFSQYQVNATPSILAIGKTAISISTSILTIIQIARIPLTISVLGSCSPAFIIVYARPTLIVNPEKNAAKITPAVKPSTIPPEIAIVVILKIGQE